MEEANEVIISIGSNSVSCKEEMELALIRLGQWLDNMVSSTVYSTPSVSGKGQDYLNAVVAGSTRFDYSELNALAKKYEIERGRDEKSRMAGIVPIDLDIVVYNGEVVRPKDFNQTYFRIGYSSLPENLK